MSRRRKKRHQLATGQGSSEAQGLEAPPGFERHHVLDVEGRPSTVIRRVDNLVAMKGLLGSERVNALIGLRMAMEAQERGLTPRCGLDMSPGSGPDGFLILIGYRIDAAALAGDLWAAVPEPCHRTVRAVVLNGLSLNDAGADVVGRRERVIARLTRDLEIAADMVAAYLDHRFGRARTRVA